MEKQRTGDGAKRPRSAEPKVATITARVSRLWRIGIRSPDTGWEQRLEALDARMERLEAALEALQDAAYRQAVLQDENIGELRARTEPEQMARDLSRDARRRGL